MLNVFIELTTGYRKWEMKVKQRKNHKRIITEKERVFHQTLMRYYSKL